MATPKHKNHCPRDHEIYYFDRTVLSHYYYILTFSAWYQGEEKKIWKKNITFYSFKIQIKGPLKVEGGGVMKFSF